MSNERRLFLIAIVAGTLLRILQTATSLGSLDAMLWYRFAEILDRVGVLGAYSETTLMNHPPLVLAIARVANRIGVACGLEFQDTFRLLQIAADVVTACVLVRIVRRVNVAPYAPLLFFLSPAVLFISAFHCNSDPLMMMFVALAAAAAIEERPVIAGLALACAVGIKIVPLLVGPLFLFALRGKRARLQFLGACIAGAGVIFVPALVVNGSTFVQQVFGYTGFVRAWGIPLLAHVIQATTGVQVPLGWLPFALVGALVALWWFNRSSDATRLPALIATTYLIVLFLAPGFGVQYLYWPLPFLAFALPRAAAIAFHAVVSLYVFAIYTVWSQGWPWWFADSTGSPQVREILSKSGLGLWVLIGVAAVVALRYGRRRPDPSLRSG
ncbi:MAG TPA: glycosyltransferase 87 family protein [Thermoanaerobaculia bacterium]|nr:glycosyltransferase 87 family protein [Thermoanaerobaculia bacterium]